MKKIYYLLLLVLGVVFFSCSEEASEQQLNRKMVKLTKNEVLSVAYYDPKELSESDIFSIVQSFIIADDHAVTRNTATSFKITKKTYINKEGEFDNIEKATRSVNENDDITSTICEVEFKNGHDNGLAVVAANAKLPSVIAFIPNRGSNTTMELSGSNELLHASKASYLYKAIKTKELVDSLRQPTFKKISKELEIPIDEISYEKIKNNIILTDASSSTRTTAVSGQPAGVQKLPSSIAPLIKTNWGQDSPYNGFFYVNNRIDWVRTENNGMTMEAVPVGCVNVALAQIMGYTHLKRNNLQFTIPGSNVTYTPDLARMTATALIDDPKMSGTGYMQTQYLMLNLYEMNKTTSKKDWDGAVVSSEVSEENMLNTMNKYFKYNAKDVFFGDLVWASLRNGNPVLMLTSNHAFIISGILITEMAIKTRELVKTSDVYWHANFGWADKNTGYYQLDQNANTYFEAGGVKGWCYKMNSINNIRQKI